MSTDFSFAEQAERLGDCVDRFALLAKNLNGAMLTNDRAIDHIGQIVGAGPYNRAVTKPPSGCPFSGNHTVLFTEDLRRARSQKDIKHEGLFAALAAAHHPLIGFPQNLLVRLGKQGFKAVITDEGEKATIPLQELALNFDEQGRILTSRAIKGSGKTIPADFVLTEHAYAEEFQSLLRQRRLNMHIVDADNKPVADQLMVKMLWTDIAGKGKNIYQEGCPKNNVLASKGIDDMEDANAYVIEVVKALQAHHGFDPKPLWDDVMASARRKLELHLPALAIVRESIAIADREEIPSSDLVRINDPHHVRTIDDLVKFFGLSLPALDVTQLQTAGDIVRSRPSVTAGTAKY